jgi:hypothetical protein
VKPAKGSQFAAVHVPVFRRQALVQVGHFVLGLGMIQKVKEQVYLPRRSVAEIALSYLPIRPLLEESKDIPKIARPATGAIA